MNTPVSKFLFWIPRVLTIPFALFLSLFALDAFGGEDSIWMQIVGFIIQLLPTALVVVALVVAWRWEWVGAVLFAALGVWYITMTHGKFDWVTYAVISGSLFLISFLFILSRAYGRQPSEQ